MHVPIGTEYCRTYALGSSILRTSSVINYKVRACAEPGRASARRSEAPLIYSSIYNTVLIFRDSLVYY